MTTHCVVGDDATMVADATRRVIAEQLGELDASLAVEDFTVRDAAASDPIVPRVLDALSTPPLLVARRVVVVRDAQHLTADETSGLLAWIGTPTTDTTLVLALVGPRTHRLVKAADEVHDVRVGSRQADRIAYLDTVVAQYGLKIDRSTLPRIADVLGDDVARADSLARTLASVFGGAPIRYDDLAPYLGDAGDVPEWDLTDAIDGGDPARAIAIARRMLGSRSRSGLQIVAILQRYVTRLAKVAGGGVSSEDEAASLLGVSRYPAAKLWRAAQRLGAARVSEAVSLVARADLDLKGGVTYGSRDGADVDPTEVTVVEVLVARLARLSAVRRR